MKNQQIISALNWRYAVKVFDPSKKIREAGYGQPKITDASHLIVVTHRTDADSLSPELIERTAKTQGKTAEQLAGLKGMADNAIGSRKNPQDLDSWLAAQTYIPLGMMIETAALLGIDAGPMEGFNLAQVDEILGLKAKNLASTTMIAFGYRGDDPYAKLPKTRRAFNEVVEIID